MSVILYVCRYAGSGIPLVTFHRVCMDMSSDGHRYPSSKCVRANHLVTCAMVIQC